ncbi:MAG: hypothetical protein JNL98_07365 [Bryobacterales bacterium]|nr:hypothetical protein [Bryobacterales bacterium]
MLAVTINNTNSNGSGIVEHFTAIPTGCCAALAGPTDTQPFTFGVNLLPGDNDFYVWMNGERQGAHWAVNLFLTALDGTPEISVFAPASSSPSGPFQPFQANPSTSSTYTFLGLQSAAGTLSFFDGTNTITLTQFWFVEYSNNGARDVINEAGQFAPDNRPDGVGFFRLNVSAGPVSDIPEPGTAGLAAAGLLLVGMARFLSANRAARASGEAGARP